MADEKISVLGDGEDLEQEDFLVVNRASTSPFNFKIAALKIVANLDWVIIRKASEFPTPLESKRYIITGEVTITTPLEPPKDLPCGIVSDNTGSSKLTYSGVETAIKNTDFGGGLLLVQDITLSATLGTLCDITGTTSSLVLFDHTFVSSASVLGTIDTSSVIFFLTFYESVGQGWVFNDNDSIVFSQSRFKNGLNEIDSVMLTFAGSQSAIQVSSCFFFTNGANESILNLIPDLIEVMAFSSITATGAIFSISGYDISKGGSIFAAGSLDQTDLNVKFVGNQNVPDSTVKAKMSFTNNTAVTDIVDENVAVKINAVWTHGSIEERIVFQDVCTFDNATNTINTTFDHAMSDEDQIVFIENGGLPTGLSEDILYFLVNSTATSFQVEEIIGGGVVAFTTDGTPDNYYRHNTGDSEEGWLIYTGLEEIFVLVTGWLAVQMDSGTNKNVGARLIKTDTSFVETVLAEGGLITPSSSIPVSSPLADLVPLSTGEGIKVFVENRENTTDVVCPSSVITLTLI